MPCNSRISQAVSEGNLNLEILVESLRVLKLFPQLQKSGLIVFADADASIEGSYWNGKLVVRSYSGGVVPAEALAKIKQAYAGQAVRVAAKRCGWSVSSSVASPNKIRMSRG